MAYEWAFRTIAGRLRERGFDVGQYFPRGPFESLLREPFLPAEVRVAVQKYYRLEAIKWTFFEGRFPTDSPESTYYSPGDAAQEQYDNRNNPNYQYGSALLRDFTLADYEYLEKLDKAIDKAQRQFSLVIDAIYGPAPLYPSSTPEEAKKDRRIPTISAPLAPELAAELLSDGIRYWRARGVNTNPCGGDVRMWVSNRLSTDHAGAQLEMADPNQTCTITIRAGAINTHSEDNQNTVIHELGHTENICHSADPRNVMYGDLDQTPPGSCIEPEDDWLRVPEEIAVVATSVHPNL